MTLGTMLSSLILGPLKLFFELIFSLANRVVSVGFSIVVMSLCMNIVVLPLYRRADAIQDEERETEARLAPGVEHIRKTFHGDQQFMTLQTYYRQNHYSRVHALKGLLPLTLEIPFFLAAYQFLSGLGALNQAHFGPIADLGSPDGLLALGAVRINVLPVLMTVINLISGEIYSHDAPLKDKIQLYVMALIFLVLLYASPAGLTLYWTLNNLFSLVKNLIVRHRRDGVRDQRKVPAYLDRKPNPKLFFLAAALITLLVGALIPSAVIVSSPSEFVDASTGTHPLWYIVNSLLLAAGTFVLWFGVYYLLGSPRMKKGMEAGIWILAGIMVIDYMVFTPSFGLLSSTLQYEVLPAFTAGQKLINLGAVALTAAVFLFLAVKWEKTVQNLCLVGALAVAVMSGANIVQSLPPIRTALAAVNSGSREQQSIPLSRNGKNVVVLMLDRAVDSFVPCVFAEKPEIRAQFDGFTWYSNTLSHGAFTNFGTPGLFGGYEYTPWEMNMKSDRLLPDKHDEALLVMPTMFGRMDYDVTVVDPPYAGSYAFVSDLSIYDGLENVRAFHSAGETGGDSVIGSEHLRMRNFFCYALCETSPRLIYGTLYNAGFYNEVDAVSAMQVRTGVSTATGQDMDYLLNLSVLSGLNSMTDIREDGNTLLLMTNDITHNPQLLQTPGYESFSSVDNTAYDAEHADRFSAGPIPLTIENQDAMAHYHVNLAALQQIGKWLDYLRDNGVYDNTRIILVSDHGRGLPGAAENTELEPGKDLFCFNPLLLVKDFDSRGEVKTDSSFMTNADVVTMVCDGLIEHPVNPFTGKEINGREERLKPQRVTSSFDWDTGTNQGTVFSPADWYDVEGDALDLNSWTYVGVH